MMHVMGRNHGRKRKKKEYAYLLGTPGTLADLVALDQPIKNLLNDVLLNLGLLLLQRLATHAGLLLLVLEGLFDKLDIL